jgi:hypothetical protein
MTSAKINSAEPPDVVTEYETLRRAALGDALPLNARAGLMLFLRRGLWGWARALATMTAFEQPTGSRPASWKAPEEYRTVIHIFAALAIRTTVLGATS